MKLSFDLDGCIAEGKYVVAPERGPHMYANLLPYDCHTADVWNRLLKQHEVYIITSRSYPGAAKDARGWLIDHGMFIPCGIITMGPKSVHADKAKVIEPLGIEWHIDDSPAVWRAIPKCSLMDNPGWAENQAIDTATRIKSWKEIEETIESIHTRELQTSTSNL